LIGDFSVKKLTQVGLLLALILGFSSYSQAALLIEPVVGYSLNTKFETAANDILTESLETKGNGLSYGGRLGYQNLGFQLGLDYLKSSLTIDESGLEDSVSMSEWGAFVGFEFPVLLRVYAGYIFSATADAKETDGSKLEFTEGSGVKFGIGFTVLPFIDINVEYRKGTFGEFEMGGVKTGAETDYSSLMLGLSLPFTI
jgi:hypothetical protein